MYALEVIKSTYSFKSVRLLYDVACLLYKHLKVSFVHSLINFILHIIEKAT